MTESQKLIERLKKEKGMNDEQIMDLFFESFKRGVITGAQLEELTIDMGYELTEEFKKDLIKHNRY